MAECSNETEVEITILPDGSFLVNRGNLENNKIIYKLLKNNVKDHKAFQEFISMADESTILIGKKTFCG